MALAALLPRRARINSPFETVRAMNAARTPIATSHCLLTDYCISLEAKRISLEAKRYSVDPRVFASIDVVQGPASKA
ncbi:hypothetical protein P0D69_12690 [Paraburkholderia sediminicola]|uniref:hypothetical protein n=1 Tax=Paraburkholderia sediminicola TaxID=458836 RepID=UPI0038B90550